MSAGPPVSPAPFTLLRPRAGEVPRLLFDSPHSGRYYPPDWETRCTRLELRRGEDAYVDELIAHAVAAGAVVLAAMFPRCWIDVNRAATDLDPALLAEPWPGPEPLAPSEKSRRGLGLIRRYVVPGVEVPLRPLRAEEVAARLARAYRPYHAALDTLIAELREARGTVWHVNWHSMKAVGNAMTPDGDGARRPDIVVSDRRGRSADPAFTSLVVDTLTTLGYDVARNEPYQGGAIVERLGDPRAGVHSIQIELNRALYLDELAVEKTGGFERLRADIVTLAHRLAAATGA